MGEILFLAHRIPFPPDRGDKIRSHHLLKALAGQGPVHVGCFADTDDDRTQEDNLAMLAASHCLVERSKPLWRAGAEAVLSGKPVSLTAFYHSRLRRWVQETLSRFEIDTIFVFSGQMGQYIPDSFSGRVIVDLCDVDSAKFEAYGKNGAWPRRLVDAREGPLLAKEEARLARRADHVLLISDNEAGLFRSRIGEPEGVTIDVLRNGIDAEFFNPSLPDLTRHGSKDAIFDGPGPHCIFTGQMDYAPNIAAAMRVIGHILPALRKTFSDAQFHVIGRAPTAQLRAYDGREGVRIWGAVPDMRPFLAHSDCVLAPLEIARGVQNKVLEAMAMARPIVLTPGAATGIDAHDGKQFHVADSNAELLRRIQAVLSDRQAAQAMGTAAREYVIRHQSWPAMLATLPYLLGRQDGRQDGRQGQTAGRRNAA
ncbi:MAG: TIGR03087 family PEP-CTERM/XrtA system glycosyltransferase [Sphingomonadaceae bacterium]